MAEFQVALWAKQLYDTYCAAVGGKAYNGDPLPTWDVFIADPYKKKQSDAWIAVALAAVELHEQALKNHVANYG